MAEPDELKDDIDTSVNDEVDTSTNEDTEDTDDFDGPSFDDVEDDETEQDEAEEPAATETEEESESEGDVAKEEVEPESDAEEETAKEDTAAAEEQKRRNDEFARQRIAEKQAKLEAKRQQQAEYLQTAEDDQTLALRQLQIDAYNNRIEANENKLQSGIDRAVANIDLFTKGAPEVKEELLKAVDDFEKLYVKYDKNGDPLVVEGDVYQYLTERADSIRRLTDVGARQNAKDRTKATTRTITPPSQTPKQPKVDPDLDAFDEEANRW